MEILTSFAVASFAALVVGFVLLAFGANAVVSVCLQALGRRGARTGLVFGLALVTVGSILPEVSLILGTKHLQQMIDNKRIYVALTFGALPESVGFTENSTEPLDKSTTPERSKRAVNDPALKDLRDTLVRRITTGIPLGLIFGSSLINLLLVIGIAGLRFGRPLPTSRPVLMRDGLFLLIGLAYVGAVIAITKLDIGITGPQLGWAGIGAALVYVLVAMTTSAPVGAQSQPRAGAGAEAAAAPPTRPMALPVAIPAYLYFFGGLAALWQGASLIIDFIADHMMWLHLNFSGGAQDVFAPLALFGLALGVAIPELVAASIIARRDEPDLALGTVLTATVLNLLGGLGIAIALFPGPDGLLAGPLAQFSIDWLVLVVAVLCTFFFLLSGKELSTGESLVLIVLFFAYVALRLPLPVSESCGTMADCASNLLERVVATGRVSG